MPPRLWSTVRLQVAGRRGVHGSLDVFNLSLVEGFGIFRLTLVGTGEEVLLVTVLGDELHKLREVLVAEEYLALTVLDIVLQIEGDGFGGAEVLHVLADGLAQLLQHAEEVVDRVLAVEDDGGIVTDMDTRLSEVAGRNAHNLEKFIESEIDIVLMNQITVGRFLQIGGFRLRYKDFFDFHDYLWC